MPAHEGFLLKGIFLAQFPDSGEILVEAGGQRFRLKTDQFFPDLDEGQMCSLAFGYLGRLRNVRPTHDSDAANPPWHFQSVSWQRPDLLFRVEQGPYILIARDKKRVRGKLGDSRRRGCLLRVETDFDGKVSGLEFARLDVPIRRYEG